MTEKEIWDKAYNNLLERYSGKYHVPDVRILSRYHHEKAILQESEFYVRYLALFARIRETAEQKGEHISVPGTAGSSFIAYLLGATDINPLPRHEYCPKCHTTRFPGHGTPFDRAKTKCPCGEEMLIDGHNIPFESNIRSVLSNHLQLCVSEAFFDEAQRMIREEMDDQAIITLKNEESSSPTWFCFLDKDENEDREHPLDGNAELFREIPRITLTSNIFLDKYRELEVATGYRMKDIGELEFSFVYPHFWDGLFDGIPNLDTDFLRDIFNATQPTTFDEMLKLIGFAHGTNVWKENGEKYSKVGRLSLREMPAYREDVYEMIFEKLRSNGIYDVGLAYEVAENVRRGYYAKNGGIDEETMLSLVDIGFDMDFILFLENINYMFPKAHGIAYLRDAIRMMFYKLRYEKEYSAIMVNR